MYIKRCCHVNVCNGRRCLLTDRYQRDVEVVLETSNTALPPPASPLPPRHSVDDSDDDDDDDDVMASARSRSPSSDVENILDALRDTTTTYYGDFTLRRVFSLEEELVSYGATETDAGVSAEQKNRKSVSTQADRGGHQDDRQSMWTLPLARRLTPAAIGKSLTRVFRRFNGFTQRRTTADDDEYLELPDNSVVSAAGPTAMSHSPGYPVNVVEYMSTSSSPRPDIIRLMNASGEEDNAATDQAMQTVCVDRSDTDVAITALNDLANNDDESRRFVEQSSQNNCVCSQTDQTRPVTTSVSSASPVLDEVQQRQLELSGIPPCSRSEIVSGLPSQSSSTVTDEFRVLVSSKSKPVQRSSSNRDASRPPIQPRPSNTSGGQWRRSATPSRASVDCLPGLTTVGVSRTSSCEVLVDDDEDSRLSDIITRRSSVTRRSSCASSAADDGDSTAASETDSLAACLDIDDYIADSLLDRLLLRLQRSTPRDSASSRGRRPFTQMSLSSSSDEDIAAQCGVDVTAHRALPSCISRKHSSLLSSLDDFTTDSDFELGSSLSQLMVTPGKSPRHPSTSDNSDRLRLAAASLTDLPRTTTDQLDNYRDWLENYTDATPPRPAADAGASVSCELANSATVALSAPITESQPAQIHVARTSKVPLSSDR